MIRQYSPWTTSDDKFMEQMKQSALPIAIQSVLLPPCSLHNLSMEPPLKQYDAFIPHCPSNRIQIYLPVPPCLPLRTFPLSIHLMSSTLVATIANLALSPRSPHGLLLSTVTLRCMHTWLYAKLPKCIIMYFHYLPTLTCSRGPLHSLPTTLTIQLSSYAFVRSMYNNHPTHMYRCTFL